MVRKNPARIHQPPSASGTKGVNPHSGPGGSSESQKNSRTKACGSQLTEASRLSPMISIAKKPNSSEARPSQPR